MKNLLTILGLAFAFLGNAQLTLNDASTPATCSNSCDGTAGVTVSGGSPPYTYQWNDPGNATTQYVSGMCPGTYTVTVTDAELTSEQMAITVGSPNPLSYTTDSLKTISCIQDCDGFISLTPNGGTPPININWSNGETTTLIQNLCADTYAFTLTDQNNCTTQASYLLNLAPMSINASPTGTTNEIAFTPTVPEYFNDGYWEFGDGTTSQVHDPTHTYASSGIYEVCITARDTIGGCQRKKCDLIHVGNTDGDCYAEFQVNIWDSLSVFFSNTSEGNHDSFHWDFGDGNYLNTEHPAHIYGEAGTYQVCLSVFNSSDSCQSTKCKTITIGGGVEELCKSEFTFTPTPNGFAFQNISEGNIAFNHWNFDDGHSQFSANAVHDFNQPGNYNVCLTIKDTVNQCQDQFCKNVIVQGPDSVMCNANFSYHPVNGNNVMMNPVVNGNITDYFWNIDNQASSFAQGGVITFPGEGVFNVCLTVLDTVSGCVDTYCDDVVVTDSMQNFCNADFSIMVDGMTANCHANDLGTVTGHMWSYGDGYFSHWENPEYEYSDGGVYEVCLTVFDTVSHCMDTHCEDVIIEDGVTEPCFANFSFFYHPTKDTVFFQPQTSGNIASYYWSFGDNTPAQSNAIPAHQYVENGYYNVCLTVTNASGCQASKCKVIAVGDVTNACYADFNYFENNITSTAHFENKSLGTIDSYHWTFGDGDESFQYEPSHTYASTGFYPACLVVENSFGCERIKCKEVRVGNELENKCLFSCVWPGDANNDLEANHYDLLPIGLNFGETGPARDSVSTFWTGHYSLDWATFQWDGVNNKHGDCDGNGIIEVADLLALEENFAYSHPEDPRSMAGEPLYIEILTPNVVVGEDIEIAVLAGESANIDLYGIGFELTLDPSLFDFSTLVVDYSNSWLGTENDDLITFEIADDATSTLYIAESRSDQTSTEGAGEIARIRIQAIGIDEDGTEVMVTTNGGLNLLGDTVDFTANEVDTVLINTVKDIDPFKMINIYPNPSLDVVYFNVPTEINTFTLNIYDLSGKRVVSETMENLGKTSWNVSNLPNGFYEFEIISDEVKYVQKLTVLHP